MKARIAARTAALCAWLLLPLLASAHAHLEASQPAEGSVINAAPARFVLRFSEPAQLTSLTLLKTGSREPLKIAAPPAVASTEISIPSPAASVVPGSYELRYRVLSADGHIMSGSIHFTLANP